MERAISREREAASVACREPGDVIHGSGSGFWQSCIGSRIVRTGLTLVTIPPMHAAQPPLARAELIVFINEVKQAPLQHPLQQQPEAYTGTCGAQQHVHWCAVGGGGLSSRGVERHDICERGYV